MSSAPNAGAIWTSPVPSSVVTKDPGITTWASGIFMMPNGAWYLAPTIACPGNRATTRQSWSSTLPKRSSATTTRLPVAGEP